MENEERCKKETMEHQSLVLKYIQILVDEMVQRGYDHDNSKLNAPELEEFTKCTPFMRESAYCSDAYNQNLDSMKAALEHHYQNNRHHPQHFKNGIRDMNLVDVIEMYCDWCASAKKHDNGSFLQGLEINKTRFQMSDELISILGNTFRDIPF